MSDPTTEIPAQLLDVDLASGQRVGEYEVVGKLGQGAFGSVFHAVHPLIGKAVAIKVLARRFSVDPEMVSRFIAEARAVNQIRHRHIIDIFSFGQLEDGRHYYVMEYLDGETLDVLIEREQRLPVDQAIAILAAIGKALDAAHAKGIAHRDLKAENVFLGSDPDSGAAAVWPKLLDFGIAKLLAPEDDALKHKTRTGAPIGTPYYMSPEQCRGKEVDHRTDHYAFGVLAYLMLTGVYPFDGDSYLTILMQQINDPPPRPSSHVPELPEAIDDVVLWLMAKSPADRPADLRTAVHALEEAAIGAGLIAAPVTRAYATPAVGVTRVSAVASVPAAQTIAPSSSSAAGARASAGGPAPARRRAILGGALVVVAAAIVGVTLIVTRSSPPAHVAEQPQPQPQPAPQPAHVAKQPQPSPQPPPKPAPTPETVIIAIDGVPDGTEVLGGGMTVGAAPGPVQLPYSTEPIVLTFKADGYLPTSRSVIPDRDQPLAISLKKKPRSAPQRTRDDLLDPFGGHK